MKRFPFAASIGNTFTKDYLVVSHLNSIDCLWAINLVNVKGIGPEK